MSCPTHAAVCGAERGFGTWGWSRQTAEVPSPNASVSLHGAELGRANGAHQSFLSPPGCCRGAWVTFCGTELLPVSQHSDHCGGP